MKSRFLIYVLAVGVLLGFFSCKEEPVVYSEWSNITLVNEYGYDLPDTFNAKVQIITADDGNYTTDCVFARASDSTFVISKPIKIPTQSKAIYFSVKVDINGWYLYAETNRYGYFDYSPENEVAMVISSGQIDLSYFIVDSIDYTTAAYRFKLLDLGTDTIIDLLLRLETADHTVVFDSVFPPVIGAYASRIRDLLDGSEYILALYAHNISGYSLIEREYFQTLALPIPFTITTYEVSGINRNSATFWGEVIYLEDSINIVERGFVWDIYSQPECSEDQYYACGGGAGILTGTVYSLNVSTKYYVRAYVKTEDLRYYYGNQVSFTTDSYDPASVADVTIHSVGSNSAFLSSYIISTGGQEITDKGFICSLTNNPTFQSYSAIAYNGPGDESFYKIISGLLPNTKYYVRAFIVTDIGVYYGEVNSFRTDL